MARNLYILAGTLCFFAVVSFGLSFSNIAQQPGSAGDAALWRTMAIGFFILALVTTLSGVLSALFEQAERRAEDARRTRREEQGRGTRRGPA